MIDESFDIDIGVDVIFSCSFFLSLPYGQIDVYINERPGIHFLEITGGLSTKALANAITKTHASSEVMSKNRVM